MLLALFIGSIFYSLVGNWFEVSLVNDILAGVPVSANDLHESELRQEQSWIITLSIWLLTSIVFMVVVARLARACEELGTQDLKYTSYAVVSYFIPFLNLVRPYRAMQEVWTSTEPNKDSSSFGASFSQPSSLVKLWWGLWIISRIYGNHVLRAASSADTNEELQMALYKHITSDVIDFGLAIVTLLMIKAVLDRVERKWVTHFGATSVPAAKVRSL